MDIQRRRARQTSSARTYKQRSEFLRRRESWTIINGTELVLLHSDDKEFEDVSGFALWMKQARSNKAVTIDLTGFTVAELDTFVEYIQRAAELARPICAELDECAQEAYEDGDDSFTRLYREVPIVHVREWRKPRHDPGVPSRPDGASRVDGDDADEAERPGSGSRNVPDDASGDLETTDHQPETDGDQVVGAVPGSADLPGELPDTEAGAG